MHNLVLLLPLMAALSGTAELQPQLPTHLTLAARLSDKSFSIGRACDGGPMAAMAAKQAVGNVPFAGTTAWVIGANSTISNTSVQSGSGRQLAQEAMPTISQLSIGYPYPASPAYPLSTGMVVFAHASTRTMLPRAQGRIGLNFQRCFNERSMNPR